MRKTGPTSTLRHWFSPTIDAFLTPSLPFQCRWRLRAVQPIALLAYSLNGLPWLFLSAFEVVYIATCRPNHSPRAIVFSPRRKAKHGALHPIHLDIHGGAFMGGLPENEAAFCLRLSQATGAVVVSTQYRSPPRHVFPAAHEDIEAAGAECGEVVGSRPETIDCQWVLCRRKSGVGGVADGWRYFQMAESNCGQGMCNVLCTSG